MRWVGYGWAAWVVWAMGGFCRGGSGARRVGLLDVQRGSHAAHAGWKLIRGDTEGAFLTRLVS